MNRLRASRLSVAWLFLAGLVSAALTPLAGCGGETGGITSGVGGALLNVRVQTFVATLNVGTTLDDNLDRPRIVNAIGKFLGSGGTASTAKSFRLILKGAAFDSSDQIIKFNLDDNSSRRQLYALADGDKVTRYLVKDDADQTLYYDPEATDVEKKTKATWESSGANPLVLTELKDTFLYSDDSIKPILKFSGDAPYDVTMEFFDVDKDAQATKTPFWRVFFSGAAKVSGEKLTLFEQVDVNSDPSLDFQKVVRIKATLNNVPQYARRVVLRVKEEKLIGNDPQTVYQFEKVRGSSTSAFSDPGSTSTSGTPTSVEFEAFIINRLRDFKIEYDVETAEAKPSDDGAGFKVEPGTMLAHGPASEPTSIPASQGGALFTFPTTSAETLSGLTLSADSISIAANDSGQAFEVIASLGEGEVLGKVPNSVLEFPDKIPDENNPIAVEDSGEPGTYTTTSPLESQQQLTVTLTWGSGVGLNVTFQTNVNIVQKAATRLFNLTPKSQYHLPSAGATVGVVSETELGGLTFEVRKLGAVNQIDVGVADRRRMFRSKLYYYADAEVSDAVLAEGTPDPGDDNIVFPLGETSRLVTMNMVYHVGGFPYLRVNGTPIANNGSVRVERNKTYHLGPVLLVKNANTIVPFKLVSVVSGSPYFMFNQNMGTVLIKNTLPSSSSAEDTVIPVTFRYVWGGEGASAQFYDIVINFKVRSTKGTGDGDIRIGGGKK
ncbi:MAG TPA: hypothetical protein PKA27_09865 [Fimbriimonadaceae bacterium]|nr:hypothetical protein [Fimbriimonadaceae bacterium]